MKGDAGATGPTGPTGPAGPSVLANVTYVPSYTFVGPNFEEVLSKDLGAGMYAFVATVELGSGDYDIFWSLRCELRDGSTVLGDAGAIIDGPSGSDIHGLTLNGTRAVSSSGTEISIWCKNGGSTQGDMNGAQLMILKIAGSF